MKTVEAVKTRDEITAIEATLKAKNGQIYADVWKFGLNTALRITDLLEIEFDQLDLDGRTYTLTEGKTKKPRTITLNNTAMGIITRRQLEQPSDVYLFQSHSPRLPRKAIQPISRVSVSRVFKKTGDDLKLKIGTHSMRKSRGFAMFEAGKPIEHISKILNHSSTGVTLRYIGIEADDIARSYDEFEL